MIETVCGFLPKEHCGSFGSDIQIRKLLRFHGLDTREDANAYGRQAMSEMVAEGEYLEEEEVVEDAGLFDHDEALAVKGTQLV